MQRFVERMREARRPLREHLRRPLLHGLRGVLHARTDLARGPTARSTAPCRSITEEQQQRSSASPRTPTSCSRATPADPPFVLPQTRLNEVRSFVEGGLQDVSITREAVNWGVPAAVGSRPGDLCLDRRAHQLHLRAHLRTARRGSDRAPVAGALAAARQGHPALPRGDLARDAALGRLRAAAAALHPRDARRPGRTPHVEDARQRDGLSPCRRALRARRAALLPPARGRVRCRTAASATRACTIATTASSPTSSATSSRAASR